MPRILIADDDPDVVELLGMALNAAGLETATAGNTAEAVAAVKAGGLDAVILDMGMEGSELGAPAQALKKAAGLSPKILMLTGRDLRREQAKGNLAGADATLEKTCSLDVVIATLKKLLETAPS